MPSRRAPACALHSILLTALVVATAPTGLSAQQRSALPGSAVVWPDAPPAPRTLEAPIDRRVRTGPVFPVGGPAQERPLPVYDDAGNVIRLSEIEMEMDTSGNAGAFWGLLIGAVLGSAAGSGLAPRDCEYVSGGYRYYCSPREEALNAALPGGLALVGGALGAWIGWEVDHVSFQEALEKVRERRRDGR